MRKLTIELMISSLDSFEADERLGRGEGVIDGENGGGERTREKYFKKKSTISLEYEPPRWPSG